MKESIKKNKKFIIIGLVIIVLLLIGIAFAYLTTTLHGDKEYLVRAGTLDLVLDEGNELTLEKQIPLEDSEGMKLDGFNFSLVNNGKIDTDYTIYLDDMELSEGESRIPDSSIRYSLTRNDEVFMTRNMTTMGSNPNRRVDFGTIAPDETIDYTLKIWIDYDATTEEASGKVFKGKLRVVATQSVGEETSTVLLENIPKENQYDDGTDTFITGEDPNNYIWYSGKLWRAVSVNNEAKTVKLVTQWGISAVTYNESGNTAFEGSYMEEWLNDATVDGFLGNLRDPEQFIKMDSKWNATMMSDTSKPPETSIVEDPVGLLNLYEYTMSYTGTNYSDGYLNNGLWWWTISQMDASYIYIINNTGDSLTTTSVNSYGIRPSINLRSDVKIVSGSGTIDDPYRLLGDNDKDLSSVKLNTRYSGEYIRFGNDENNLYRIVSHETRGLTKITSAEPLKENDNFKTILFGDSVNYSSSNIIGDFLNGEYLTSGFYMNSEQLNMIEDNTIWYLGMIDYGANYKLGKYSDYISFVLTLNQTASKVGLLRMGELMTSQSDIYANNSSYWLLTPFSDSTVRYSSYNGSVSGGDFNLERGIKPALNLKSNVIITGGIGTKEDPFQLELSD